MCLARPVWTTYRNVALVYKREQAALVCWNGFEPERDKRECKKSEEGKAGTKFQHVILHKSSTSLEDIRWHFPIESSGDMRCDTFFCPM